MNIKKENIASWFRNLQNIICHSLEQLDSKGKFREDIWERPGGGGGITRVMTKGDLIEKGGVNFSAVHGLLSESMAKKLNIPTGHFFATGISIVLHPNNPWVPIIHKNIRYFEMDDHTWWFGGGIDLTPHIIVKEKAKIFHQRLKNICEKYHHDYYNIFKATADDYFYIQHRKETRGIGGIFFDYLGKKEPISKPSLWEFVQDIGKNFIPIYAHAVETLRDKTWTEEEKFWQKIRRGRYVEFNLIYDKGTKFGLNTDGRTESILMSLPIEAHWEYDYHPTHPLFIETQTLLRKKINWLDD